MEDLDDVLPRHVLAPTVHKLSSLIRGARLSSQLLYQVEALLRHEVTRIRLAGHKCPDLVIVFFESLGWIEIVRADLEHNGIQRLVQNVIRRFPHVSIQQLLIAVRRAFPNYNPADTGAEAERVQTALAEKRQKHDA